MNKAKISITYKCNSIFDTPCSLDRWRCTLSKHAYDSEIVQDLAFKRSENIFTMERLLVLFYVQCFWWY